MLAKWVKSSFAKSKTFEKLLGMFCWSLGACAHAFSILYFKSPEMLKFGPLHKIYLGLVQWAFGSVVQELISESQLEIKCTWTVPYFFRMLQFSPLAVICLSCVKDAPSERRLGWEKTDLCGKQVWINTPLLQPLLVSYSSISLLFCLRSIAIKTEPKTGILV